MLTEAQQEEMGDQAMELSGLIYDHIEENELPPAVILGTLAIMLGSVLAASSASKAHLLKGVFTTMQVITERATNLFDNPELADIEVEVVEEEAA